MDRCPLRQILLYMMMIFVLLLIILTYYMGMNYDLYIIMHLNKEYKQFVLLDSICFIMYLYMMLIIILY